MRTLRRVVGGVTVTGGALGVYGYRITRQSSHALPKAEGPELTGEQWNAEQDLAAVDRAFASESALRDSGVVLNWLYGCPYCARVKALLDFHKVPYTPVDVDPVTFEQLNPMPYKACPQLQLLTPGGESFTANAKYPITVRGPMLAESEHIISKIASATKMDLKEPKVAAGRDWVTNKVARLVFVSSSSSFARAYALMPLVTPEKYHFCVARAGGAVPMWLLSKYKIAGRIEKAYRDAGDDAPQAVKDLLAKGPFTAEMADAALVAELQEFRGKLAPFHGGATPDAVDVELFGLLRGNSEHTPIRVSVNGSGLAEWYKAMKEKCRSSALTERIGL